jgi:Uma2 family endonuclease
MALLGFTCERAFAIEGGPLMATEDLLPPRAPFLLRGVDWETYCKLREALQGRHLRLTYDRGTIELMTLSLGHERYGSLLGRIIETLTLELGLPLQSAGSTTLDREDLDRGVEADRGYYLEHEPLVRDKEEIDLTVDPPPDLAIEIDVSTSSVKRLAIYAALRIPEVWRFDQEKLWVYVLGSDGQYIPVERSQHFPFLPIAEVTSFLHRRNQMDENSLVRAFRDWVREQIAKNWQA